MNNKIKLIIFDLDGVLISTKAMHYDVLNQAIEEIAGKEYCINYNEHVSIYDGLTTNQKLELLSNKKNLPTGYHDNIWRRKQELTEQKTLNITLTNKGPIYALMSALTGLGFTLVCCSNSVKSTVDACLKVLGIKSFFKIIISNEDVTNPKPHPEMYWKAMSKVGVTPQETLIVEDSPKGLTAAYSSGAHVHRTNGPFLLDSEFLDKKLYLRDTYPPYIPKWVDKKLNIVIPMAGLGTRFSKEGYELPKPLIDVNSQPMIKRVVDSLNVDANYIYVVQKSHREKYNLDMLLNLITPNCKIVETDGVTEGQACSVLLAKEYINNDNPLLIVNSDQIIEWNPSEFFYKMHEQRCSGGILTYTSTDPKLSFVKLDEHGCVTEVAEKTPISDIATVGVYYWTHGFRFVMNINRAIKENKRVNNEFYVCPLYQYTIDQFFKVKSFQVDKMWEVGTPKDLENYLEHHR